ncbi:MAG: formyltetrahydrofolate deformylase [Succinivibrionaceae bacterium]|nr:formyltetrahydrofolate deformylase [Ruminobacter sp.]MDY5780022.1 formyltetrahydrofolate deformylase [Succinivibrionaceae bacterium]MEE1340316.1 formyltetrahydrofolate deformylase [Succinivibrionaceae bacterium]
MNNRILLTECPDDKGLIAKITGVCFKHQYNIIKNDQFVSFEDNRFFMRTELEGEFGNVSAFVNEIKSVIPQGGIVNFVEQRRKKVLILVTRESHVLGDLLMKSYSGALQMDIVGVIGNYDILEDLTKRFDIPFVTVSHEGISREEHEAKMLEAISKFQYDYVILAKYMRILSPNFVNQFAKGTLINIHHSFLPAFIGAKPYQQAFDRGVKIIGATAHFVTNDLDEGPIICQDVIKVSHNYSADAMARAGRDVERQVLNRAISRVIDDKVFIHGNKTIVF